MDIASLKSNLIDGFINANENGKIKWWHAALFLAGVTVAERLLTGKKATEEAKEIYKDEHQPAWAPPAWVFGPAWGINSVALGWAGQRLLNAPKKLPNRNALLALQGAHWVIYTTFGRLEFKERSSLLAGFLTFADAGIAWASYLLARQSDPKLANAYLPLVGWTSYASTIAGYQALYNPDQLLGTKAPLKLNGIGKRLEKED
jgi:tryptophan-rich sensory protein